MEILVCIKRVPGSGASVTIAEDGHSIDTRHLSFTIGPHEECAVEEAVSIVESSGGSVTVLTVGDEDADEQLRYALSMGANHAVRVQAGDASDPQATAAAIAQAVRDLESDGQRFDLVLFGNESADAGHFQVGIRVAHALELPIVGGIKGIEVDDGVARLRRPVPDGVEVHEVPLPAAAAVKEGLNLPRYPSMPGRLRAKRATIQVIKAEVPAGGLRMTRLRVPEDQESETVILGKGPEAAPAVVDVLEELAGLGFRAVGGV